MHSILFNQAFSHVKAKIAEQGNTIISPEQQTTKVDPSFFRPLSLLSEQPLPTITCVDAGNAELIGGPTFSLQLIRLCATTYQGIQNVSTQRKEFYVFVSLHHKNNTYVYETLCFGEGYDFPSFSAFDPCLMQGKHQATPARIVDVLRTLSELHFMQALESDIILRDGPLRFDTAQEKAVLHTLLAKPGIIAGVSKTNTFITNAGNSAAAVLQQLAPPGCWAYPLTAEQGISSFFVKLHPHSEHLFVCDVSKANDTFFSALLTLSKDPLFLGYPYGLLAADQYARVSNQEKETLTLQFLTLAGKDATLIKPYLRAQDAHSILDNLS